MNTHIHTTDWRVLIYSAVSRNVNGNSKEFDCFICDCFFFYWKNHIVLETVIV